MKKRSAVLLLFIMLLTFSACGETGTQSADLTESTGAAGQESAADDSAAVQSYSVTDSRGETVTFETVPAKIVCLLPSDTEILYALGAGESIIAVDTYSNYPEDTANKQKLESGVNLNVESIIALEPDLVISGYMNETNDQIKQLEDAGIAVIITQAGSISDTYTVIDMLGQALNKQPEAAALVDDMKQAFDEIKAQAEQSTSKKTVYIEISPLEYGLWTCGAGTFEDELLTLIGAENIFSDVESWQQVSEEQVIERNPDVIISTAGAMYTDEDPVTEIESRENWDDITAVKNGAVYVMDSDAIQRPGPRLVQAAQELIQLIYGD